MAKADAKSSYVHYVPPAKKIPDWYKKYNFVLVTSMEQLEQIFKDSNWTPKRSFISFDTETTGLNPEELDIVGYSFCIDGISTYYVPVNHFQYEYNLGEPSCAYIYERMCEAQRVFMYNARFDCRMMEYIGYKEHKDEFDKKHRWNYVKFDMSKVPIMDVMNAVWNSDTNIKLPSLKWASLHFLGYEQMHFDEVIEEAGNFYYLNPSETPDTVFYAGADALCTYLLVPAVMKYYKESGMAGQLDDAVIYPLMHYEQEKLLLDYDMLCKMYDEAMSEYNQCEQEVYDALGYQINLNSSVQVGQALERLGIDTGERTDSGKMAIGIKVLESLSDDVKEKFPALKAYVKYKEVGKLISTYFSVYKKEAEDKGYLRASYKLHQVPTGRLSCGTDGKNPYFSKVNIQAMPKPHVSMFDVYDLGDRDIFSKKDNIILGYQFKMSQYDENKEHIVPDDPRYIGMAEGMNPKMNVRMCITPKWSPDDADEEYIYCAADYSAQELRIVANLSREPVWTDAFTHGRDVHKSTAIALWGEENYNKDYRKRAKGANFGIIYGAQASSFNDPSYGIYSLAEAEEFYNTYKSKLPTLFQWIDRKQRQGRKNGTVYTYFGRPRRVKGYFDNHNAAFANRTITNTQVQGCAGDMLKLVCCRLWKNLLNNDEYKDDVRFMLTIHDEIGYSVRVKRLEEILSLIEDNQTVVLKEWSIPIITEASCGWSPGGLFAFEKVDDPSRPLGFSYRPKLD